MKQLLAIIMAASISLGGCVCLGGGWVYEFDGVNDYVDAGDIDTPAAITVSAWVYSLSFSRVIAAKRDNTNYAWDLSMGGTGILYWGVNDNNNRPEYNALSNGVWYHIAGTYDSAGGAGNMQLYVDGVRVDSDTKAGTIQDNGVSVTVGRRSFVGAEGYFDGFIFKLMEYNRALPQAEIRGLYKAGGGRNDFAANESIVLPRADDQSLVFSLDRTVNSASTGDVLAEDAVITSRDAARNYGLAKGGVTVGPAAIALPAP